MNNYKPLTPVPFAAYTVMEGKADGNRAINKGRRLAAMTWKEKLTSRKFWAALAGIITGTVQLFGIEGNILTDISGAVTIIGSVIAYIIIEGKIDAQAIRITADAYQAIENIIATAHNYKEQTSNDALGIKETDPINSIDPANTKYNNNHTQEGA